jgi:hypothetical protein
LAEEKVEKKIEELTRKLEKRDDKYDPEQALRRRTGPLLHCISNLPLAVAFTAATFTVF